MLCTRRALLGSAIVGGFGLGTPRASGAVARGLTLSELVQASAFACVATPLDAACEWATFGRNRVIVTDTRVRFEEPLLRTLPSKESRVRVLGGRIGDVGERVDGQAELVLGEPCLLFLIRPQDGRAFVTGAAQGHFPLIADAHDRRLVRSPHAPTLTRPANSAIARLSGRTLAEARDLVRAAEQR